MRSCELLIRLPMLNSRNRALLWWKVNGSNRTGCSYQKLTTVFSALLFCYMLWLIIILHPHCLLPWLRAFSAFYPLCQTILSAATFFSKRYPI